MRLWRNNTPLIALVGLAGMAYPVVLFFCRNSVSPLVFVAAGLSLLLIRAGLSQGAFTIWRRPLLFALLPLIAVSLADAVLAAYLYPVALSLAAAAAFGATLVYPPSLIERLARLREPDLSPAAIAYCHKVTWVWLLWLLLNATIASALALAGMNAAWAIWTGIVAYLVSGALLTGELFLRRLLRIQAG